MEALMKTEINDESGLIESLKTLQLMGDMIQRLHDRPEVLVAYVTGAGVGLDNLLWEVAGSSRTILESDLLYSHRAVATAIRGEPKKSVSEDTAIRLAGAAYMRALELVQRDRKSVPVIGLGLTAAVGTDRVRRGADEVFIAVKTENNILVSHAVFDKEEFDRLDEGTLCDVLGLNLLLLATNVASTYPRIVTPDLQRLIEANGNPTLRNIFPQSNTDLVGSWFDHPLHLVDGARASIDMLDPSKHILFPGSFAPWTYGHEFVARQVEMETGREVVPWIEAGHPDKHVAGGVDELINRRRQFLGHRDVLITPRVGYYCEKARMFPTFGMAIGVDTVLRILDPKYYGNSPDSIPRVLAEIAEQSTTFYVCGREVDGVFKCLSDIEHAIPPHYRGMFRPISGRCDVSSTKIRKLKEENDGKGNK